MPPNNDVTVVFGLSVPVSSPAGTVVIGYPVGSKQADFTGANASSSAVLIINGNDRYTQAAGHFGIAYGVGGVTLTNMTGATLPAGTRGLLQLARSDAPLNPADNRDVNVLDFGALGDDAADDYPAIARAVAAAKAKVVGRRVRLPAGTYQLQSGEIVLDADDLHLVLDHGAVLKQMVYGHSTVQVRNANKCSVGGGGKIVNPNTKTQILGDPYDNWPARNRAAGVYCLDSNDTAVYDLTFENMVVCVQFHPLDTTTTMNSNNSVRNVVSRNHTFGLLASAQRNLIVDGLQGYTTDNSQVTAPPHLIYLTFDLDETLPSESVSISNLVDYDNPFSSSVKIKRTTGVSMVNCISRKCARGFDINCDYLNMIAPQVHELVDIGDSQQGGIELTECNFAEIINPIIILPDDNDLLECVVARVDTSDITIRGGRLSSKRTANASGSPTRLFGTRIKLIDVTIEERGANKFPVSFEATAVDCELIRPHVSMATGTRIFSIASGATGAKIEIAPALLNFTYDTTASLSDLGTNTRVSFSGALPACTLANLPPASTHVGAMIRATDAASNKNPVLSDGTNWRYPDGNVV